jgi:branched-chain amino acid transport system permease protein
MAIREDETAADCTGVNPIRPSPGVRARCLVLGFRRLNYAAKLQAITPGAFEFQVSIMLLCMVVPAAPAVSGRDLGGRLITIFDRVALAQMTFFAMGWTQHRVHASTVADVTCGAGSSSASGWCS